MSAAIGTVSEQEGRKEGRSEQMIPESVEGASVIKRGEAWYHEECGEPGLLCPVQGKPLFLCVQCFAVFPGKGEPQPEPALAPVGHKLLTYKPKQARKYGPKPRRGHIISIPEDFAFNRKAKAVHVSAGEDLCGGQLELRWKWNVKGDKKWRSYFYICLTCKGYFDTQKLAVSDE
jgi:hypothetical protein